MRDVIRSATITERYEQSADRDAAPIAEGENRRTEHGSRFATAMERESGDAGWLTRHQFGTILVMKTAREIAATARTVRFPARLTEAVGADAVRCGRSFEQQVIAVLRSHYGEHVDLAPAPQDVLALARASVAGMTAAEQELVSGRSRRRR